MDDLADGVRDLFLDAQFLVIEGIRTHYHGKEATRYYLRNVRERHDYYMRNRAKRLDYQKTYQDTPQYRVKKAAYRKAARARKKVCKL
jgi:hypothetical protein